MPFVPDGSPPSIRESRSWLNVVGTLSRSAELPLHSAARRRAELGPTEPALVSSPLPQSVKARGVCRHSPQPQLSAMIAFDAGSPPGPESCLDARLYCRSSAPHKTRNETHRCKRSWSSPCSRATRANVFSNRPCGICFVMLSSASAFSLLSVRI
jgi:hypothetical protein